MGRVFGGFVPVIFRTLLLCFGEVYPTLETLVRDLSFDFQFADELCGDVFQNNFSSTMLGEGIYSESLDWHSHFLWNFERENSLTHQSSLGKGSHIWRVIRIEWTRQLLFRSDSESTKMRKSLFKCSLVEREGDLQKVFSSRNLKLNSLLSTLDLLKVFRRIVWNLKKKYMKAFLEREIVCGLKEITECICTMWSVKFFSSFFKAEEWVDALLS